MNTVKNLSFVLALALGAVASGCAADMPDDVGEGGGNGGGGGGGGGTGSDDAPRALDASGKYAIVSTFDLATNAPGTVGQVVNAIIDMTDDATDPADWLLDQVIANTSGTFHNLLVQVKPFVAGYLNDRLLELAPDFVSTAVQLGKDFGQMARNFGLHETLEVGKNVDAYIATVTAYGIRFKIDNIEHDLMFANYSIANVTASDIAFSLDVTGKVDIGQHELPLAYGKLLRIGLDELIIPALDPSATNLQTLLAGLVDCTKVGKAINEALVSQFGIGGGAALWTSACNAGLAYGAQKIYEKIDAIDASALEFSITGVAKAVDTNNDYVVDRLQTGKWSGTLTYGNTPAPLAAATFTGTRE